MLPNLPIYTVNMWTPTVNYLFVFFCPNKILIEWFVHKMVWTSCFCICTQFFCHLTFLLYGSIRSMSSLWAPEPKMSLHLSVCWWQYAWRRGTRSWTPGSTSCWGGLLWRKSSCCSTAAGAQILVAYSAGSVACSAAQWRPATLVVARLSTTALAGYLYQTLRSNPSPEPWSEWFDLWTPENWGKKEEALKIHCKIIWNILHSKWRVSFHTFANVTPWTVLYNVRLHFIV